MSAGVSIIGQCEECCECPEAVVEWDSRSVAIDAVDYGYEYDGKYWTTRVITETGSGCCGGSFFESIESSNFLSGITTYSGSAYYDCYTGDQAGNYWSATQSSEGVWSVTGTDPPVNAGNCSSTDCLDETVACNSGGASWSVNCSTCTDVTTYENELNLQDQAEDELPPYDDSWTDTPGSYRDEADDGSSIVLRESRYRLRFEVPKQGTGRAFRAFWVERFIAEAGVALTSVEVYAAGCYRPDVTISSPPSGGTQAYALAVMSSTGTVTSILITNPGSGYVSAPTVTVESAINGGTDSTGWTATLTAGKVTAIGGGSAGDYRPTLTFSGGGGGVDAEATCTLDSGGGIATVTLADVGSGYTEEPGLSITTKVTDPSDADLLIHMGTETDRCAVWDGSTLAGEWVVREVANVGESLSSIEVVHGGSGFTSTPTLSITPPETIGVTITAPPSGGTQAVAHANVGSSGAVTGISVTNGGSGYVSAPTVTVIAPTIGGTQSTGWTATLTAGVVTSITGGTAGDYAIEATVAITAESVSSVTLVKSGAGFKTNPLIHLDLGSKTVLLAAHFGTETEYADGTQPPGAVPKGYVDVAGTADKDTHLLIGSTGTAPWKYYELPVPSTDGTTLVANVRAVCDGTSC